VRIIPWLGWQFVDRTFDDDVEIDVEEILQLLADADD
jgi:hypothetical protein